MEKLVLVLFACLFVRSFVRLCVIVVISNKLLGIFTDLPQEPVADLNRHKSLTFGTLIGSHTSFKAP